MKVRIKRLSDKAMLPKKAHATDAGFDLVATRIDVEEGDSTIPSFVCHTDLAFEIPEGYMGLCFPRSSVSKTDLFLANSVGVIDCHYRGEVTFKFKPVGFYNPDHKTYYNVGDRIGQLIIMPIPEIEFEEADELSETDRGTGGYGSSGR